MKLLLRTAYLRSRYWWRKLVSTLLHRCPDCWNTLNPTRRHLVCPQCNFRTQR